MPDVLYGVYSGGTKPGLRCVKRGDWKLSKVDVLVNQKEHFLVDLDPDVLTKSTVEFGSTLLVRELEVRVLECRDRKLGTDRVGFAELELQRVR